VEVAHAKKFNAQGAFFLMTSQLHVRLLSWYRINHRKLPWREHPHPYAVWVSEIMLQQTRVETVIPYFNRWMARFPTIKSLAAASQREVLALWEGLGYYSRARNTHLAAQIIMEELNGRLPADAAALEGLPGIGRYTAAAIASIAFGHDIAALDGNVRRVYARLFDVEDMLGSPASEKRFRELATAYLPSGHAGDYNQALMDLGATVCTPKTPHCDRCPLAELCLANARGLQADRPVRKPKQAVPHHLVTAAVIRRGGDVLIAQRPQDGLLGGLWEFPGGKVEQGEDLVTGLRREIREELDVEIEIIGSLGVYEHAYTHFRVTLHAFGCRLANGKPSPIAAVDLRWIAPGELGTFPMGKIDRQIADRITAELDAPGLF
jgi:A/G-specific adenine glycosylase